MEKDRLLAFSDGVIAIIVTIMVLELRVPHGASLQDLAAAAPVFISYVMSFIYISIYWNNHHHFLHLVRRVDGLILWANLHLLFWLSLVPFTTGWMGQNDFAPVPTAMYGVSLLMPAFAWQGLQYAIIRSQGPESALAQRYRPRPQRQALAAAVCARDSVLVRRHAYRRHAVCAGRAAVAGSRPAHRTGGSPGLIEGERRAPAAARFRRDGSRDIFCHDRDRVA